jgi:hypothetical protein
MSRRVLAAVFGVLVAMGLGPSTATARVSVAVTGLRVITADDRKPARAPYSRDTAYLYVVRYRIAGDATLTVKRRARILGPGGRVVAEVRPPAEVDEPGRYFASARIPIGANDPRADYVLRYEIRVRGSSGARDTVTRTLRLPFR